MRRLDGVQSVLDDAVLLTSELVSSAVLHAGGHRRDGDMQLIADLLPDAIRIAVADAGRPVADDDGARAADTRLAELRQRVVSRLARRWGSDGNQLMWAELAL